MTYQSKAKNPLEEWLDPLTGSDLIPILVEKINTALKEFEFKPSQILYIMIQIRKIIEYEGKSERYQVIKLYCDWLLHVKIEGWSFVVFKNIEQSLSGTIETGFTYIDAGTQKGSYPDYMLLDTFKDQLIDFCNEHSINSQLFENQWMEFIKIVINELVDFPLGVTKEKLKANNYRIISLSFKYIPDQMYYPFDSTKKKPFPSIVVKYLNNETENYCLRYNIVWDHGQAFC